MLSLIVAITAGFIHIYIFCMESLWWGTDRVNKIFRIRPENIEIIRLWAFNQGFYNLFLALGIFVGAGLVFLDHALQGRAIIDFALASIFLAGLVLGYSSGKLKSSLIQTGPAGVYFVLRFFSF